MPDGSPAPPRYLGLPRTRAGRLALLAPVVLIGGAMVPMLIVQVTGRGGDDWPTALTALAFAALIGGGIGAVACAALAVRAVLQGERSLLLLVPVAAGAVAITFALGEVLGPH